VEVRHIEALDPHRHRRQRERLAQPIERRGAALAPARGLDLLLLERQRRVRAASWRIRRFSPRSDARTSTRDPRRALSASTISGSTDSSTTTSAGTAAAVS